MNLAAGAVPGVPLFCIVNREIYYSVDGGATWTAQSRISGPITLSGEVIMPGIADFAAGGIAFSVPATFPTATGSPVQFFFSPVVDFTAAGDTTIIPPMAARLFQIVVGIEIKSRTSASVAPTLQLGTDAGASNFAASQTVSTILTNNVETRTVVSVISPFPLVDLSANGLVLRITGAATATALTGRFTIVCSFLPL